MARRNKQQPISDNVDPIRTTLENKEPMTVRRENGKTFHVMPPSEDSNRGRSFTNPMFKIKFTPSEEAPFQEPSSDEGEVDAVVTNGRAKVVLVKVNIQKETTVWTSYDAEAILVVYLLLHLDERRVLLITVTETPARSSTTPMEQATRSTISSC